MRKGTKEKKTRWNIIRNLFVLIVIGIICIFLDVKLELMTQMFNNLTELLFNLFTVVVGIWVTCYLLFLQTYKDSYSLKIISKEYLPHLKKDIIYAIIPLIYGAVVIIRDCGWLENIYFIVLTLGVIANVLWHTYKCSKSLMVNTYIDKFCEDIQKKLENAETQIDDEILISIGRVLDESLIKEEYYIIQNITRRLGDIFHEFLGNSINMIKKGNTSEEVLENFNKILNIYIFELEMCSNINSELVVEDIVRQNIDNIEFCIEAQQYEWVKKYVKKINRLNFKIQKDRKNQDVTHINVIYNAVIKKLIDKESAECLRFIIDDIFSFTKSLNFMNENKNLKYFTNLLVTAMLYSLRKNKLCIYENLFEYFEQLTMILCKIPQGFSDVLLYYALLFSSLKENNPNKIEEFIDIIFDTAEPSSEDSRFIEFKFYCISEIQEMGSDDMKDKIHNYHLGTVLSTIAMKDKYHGYSYIPDFEEQIIENKYKIDKIENICNELYLVINKSIICDNVLAYYSFLDVLSSCLNKTQKDNKDIQCALFDVYIALVYRTAKLKNRQFIEILFSKLKEEVIELDRLKNVSNEFALHIVKSLSECARGGYSENDFAILRIIELLKDFLEENKEINFICNSTERKKALYRGLFNIGTVCIENNFEEGLRDVSNALGWFIIYNLRQETGELVTYLIERASELYVFSNKMDVSSKTQTFILTLFTTVGTYCCKENKNRLHLKKILECIGDENKEKIATAVKLRTSENDMWDDLFGNQTIVLTKKFLKSLEEYQKYKS